MSKAVKMVVEVAILNQRHHNWFFDNQPYTPFLALEYLPPRGGGALERVPLETLKPKLRFARITGLETKFCCN